MNGPSKVSLNSRITTCLNWRHFQAMLISSAPQKKGRSSVKIRMITKDVVE